LTGVLLATGCEKKKPDGSSSGASGAGDKGQAMPGNHRHRDQDRPDHAVQRAGVAYGVIGTAEKAYSR